MIGFQEKTIKRIVIMSRSKSKNPSLAKCKTAIRKITPGRTNYQEIFNLISPYISGEKDLSLIGDESFIRDSVKEGVKKVIEKTLNSLDKKRIEMAERMRLSVEKANYQNPYKD